MIDDHTGVSVITPVYNCQDYISKTIKSVLLQSYQNWEMLIVDDFSSDGSVKVVESWCSKDSRIKLIRLTENSGAAIARNKAISIAKGRFIAFLDADDTWLPLKLEHQINFMENNDIAFSYTAYKKVNQFYKTIVTADAPNKLSYTDLLKACEIGCLTAIYDTKKIGKIYMPDIRKRQDLGLWLKILKKIPYAYGLDEVLAEYFVRNNSLSANKKSAALYTWRLYRDIEKMSFLKAFYYFVFYAINGVIRTKFPMIAKKIGVLR